MVHRRTLDFDSFVRSIEKINSGPDFESHFWKWPNQLQELDLKDPQLLKNLTLAENAPFTKIPITSKSEVYELNLIGLDPDQYTPAHHHGMMQYRLEMGISGQGISRVYDALSETDDNPTLRLIAESEIDPGHLIRLPGSTIHQVMCRDSNSLPFWLLTLYIPSDLRSVHFEFDGPQKYKVGQSINTVKKVTHSQTRSHALKCVVKVVQNFPNNQPEAQTFRSGSVKLQD